MTNCYPDYSGYTDPCKSCKNVYISQFLNSFPKSTRKRYIDPHYAYHKKWGPYYFGTDPRFNKKCPPCA